MPIDLAAQVATLCMFFFPDIPMMQVTSSQQDARLECFKTVSVCYDKNVNGKAVGAFSDCANTYFKKLLK